MSTNIIQKSVSNIAARIFAIILSMMLSTSAIAKPVLGLWSKTKETCNQSDPKSWIRVYDDMMIGSNWKCRFLNTLIQGDTVAIASVCGYDETDVFFRDVFLMFVDKNDKLVLKYAEGEVSFFKCAVDK